MQLAEFVVEGNVDEIKNGPCSTSSLSTKTSNENQGDEPTHTSTLPSGPFPDETQDLELTTQKPADDQTLEKGNSIITNVREENSPQQQQQQQQQQPPLCKHWAKLKQCAYHSRGKCKFSHPDSTIPKYCAVVNPASEDDNRPSSSSSSSTTTKLPRHRTRNGRLQTRNDSRVAQFRHFIATKLREATTAAAAAAKLKSCNPPTPLEEAKVVPGRSRSDKDNSNNGTDNAGEEEEGKERGGLEGHRVLDVAGGKGELAYQLIHLCGVESCHVVDPRSLSLRRFILRRQRGNYHKSLFLFPEIVSSRDDEEKDVGHLRCLFTQELWTKNGATSNNNDDDDGVTRSNELLFQQMNGRATEDWVWPPPPSKNKTSSSNEFHHLNSNDRDDDNEQQSKTPFPSYDHATSITQSATLIVGMHSDGAVDAIVDAALHLNISFFVVPCCTYSSVNHRIVPLGDRIVKTYDELLDYLQAKSNDIQRAELPFEGKNICLYRVVV